MCKQFAPQTFNIVCRQTISAPLTRVIPLYPLPNFVGVQQLIALPDGSKLGLQFLHLTTYPVHYVEARVHLLCRRYCAAAVGIPHSRCLSCCLNPTCLHECGKSPRLCPRHPRAAQDCKWKIHW